MIDKDDLLFWLLIGVIMLSALILISGACWIAYEIAMSMNVMK